MVPLCSEKFYLFLFWSRLVHADLAMHATGCARHLTPLYVPVSLCTRSATCKPCPMALVPDSTVHCSRPPARNLDLSWSDHALGPWVGFIYTYKHIYLHTGALSGHHSVPFALSALEPFFGDFSAAGPRLVARLAPSDSPQPRGPCPRAGPPPPRPSRSASEVARSR